GWRLKIAAQVRPDRVGAAGTRHPRAAALSPARSATARMPDTLTPPPTDRADLARALFEESGDALFLIDPATGACVDANPVALRLSGYTRDELREMAAAHLFRQEAAGGSTRLRNALAHTDRHLHGLHGFLDGRLRWLDVIHPADRPALEAAERELLAGRTDAAVEYRIVRPDGTVRWGRESIRASPGRTGRRLDGVLSDVTDRKAADEAAR